MVTALFKVVLMGDGSVGKTSLRRTYMGEGFRANYMITIGADFAVKKMQLAGGHDVSIQTRVCALPSTKGLREH
ncbi:MAG: hypothetical protein ACTSPB_13135 [Candidatus Thorarchaeota archaeon]